MGDKVLTFREKLLELYSRFSYVQKTGKNQHFKYSFMEESQLKRKLNTAMRELGLVIAGTKVTPVGECTGKSAVVIFSITLMDRDSDATVTLEGIGGGMDSGDKGPCKAIVSAMKYALANGLAVETGNDPEADASTDEDALAEVQSLIEAATSRGQLELVKPRIAALKGHDGFDGLKEMFRERAAALDTK